MDDKIIGPLFGYKNGNELHHSVSCYHSIPKLKIPTLFITSKDDPVIGKKAVDYEIFKSNEYAVLATT
jgi:predicted alpha/beta-fold hydrolase